MTGRFQNGIGSMNRKKIDIYMSEFEKTGKYFHEFIAK